MGFLFVILWSGIGFAILQSLLPRFDQEEQRWLGLSFGMHILFALILPPIVNIALGGGDMFWYHRAGNELAALWQSDPGRWTGNLFLLATRQKTTFPFWVHGIGTSTGAMFGVSAWLMLICGGSVYAACVLLSVLNFFSRLLTYTVFRKMVGVGHRRYVMWAMMLLPSAVFWTAGLMKESVAMTGLGFAVYGSWRLAAKGDFVLGIALIVLGAFPMYLVKPYVLFPLAIAAPTWYVIQRLKESGGGAAVLLTPWRLVLFAGLVAVGISALTYLVPSLSMDNIGDELASFQHAGTRVAGNTNYSLVPVTTGGGGPSRMAQVAAAPFGFFFALTRPWFFEARSAQMLVATLESTFLAGLLILAVRRIGVFRWIRRLLGQPWLMFCAAYVVIFGVAVGLGSTNLGSLSRYRVPMMGYYAVLVAMSYVWAYRTADENAATPVLGSESGVITRRSLILKQEAQRVGTGRRAPLRIRNAHKHV